MSDMVLWKRLYPNDFNAINGTAAPGGGGGGARHIVLGTRNAANDVPFFIGSQSAPVVVATEAGPNHPASTLTFGINPARSDEWRIADQVNHRHPALTAAEGFPSVFDSANRPVVLVLKVDQSYHVRHLSESDFGSIAPLLAARDRGVADLPPTLLAVFGLTESTALKEFEEQIAKEENDFDPKDIEDARRRVFAEIIRRQGQKKFRADLVDSYGGCCAITGCVDVLVLEAAHITPYRGTETNHLSNGLLLRADIHTLFDLGLLAIDPGNLTVLVSSLIQDPDYRALQGRPLAAGKVSPSMTALKEHHQRFEA